MKIYNRSKVKSETCAEIADHFLHDPYDESIEDDYWFRVNYDPGFMWLD